MKTKIAGMCTEITPLSNLKNGKGEEVLRDGKAIPFVEAVITIYLKDEFEQVTGQKENYAVTFFNERAEKAVKAFTIGSNVEVIAYVESKAWETSEGKKGWNTQFNGQAFNVVKI